MGGVVMYVRHFTLVGVLALIVAVSGCAPKATSVPLTPTELHCRDRALACPLKFTMPSEEADDAWARAQSYIGRFASLNIQTATDYVIQTYKPRGNRVDFGYSVTRAPMGEETQFTVRCTYGNRYSRKDARNNAHFLAHYIRTGELVHPSIIAK
jgi:hypothetical protein